MALLPLFHDLTNRTVLLVGAGTVARDKLRALLPTGAWIRIVALQALPEVIQTATEAGIPLALRSFEPADLEGVALVVSATNDPALNAAIVTLGRAKGVLVNAVDDPPNCDVFFAATWRRGPLILALGTEGTFPGLSRSVREALDALVPEGDADLLQALTDARQELLKRLPDPAARRAVLLQLVETFRTTYLHPETQP